MIVLICGHYPVYENGWDTGKTEFVASHGIDSDTDEMILVSQCRPEHLGAVFDHGIGEWVIDNG